MAGLIVAAAGWFAKTAWLNKRRLSLLAATSIHRDERIRVSVAYLFRIRIDESYLLIKGHNIGQYQPIGGVYKTFPSFKKIEQELDVRRDDHFKHNGRSDDDLRVTVPRRNLLAFIDWFDSREDREVETLREFKEELVDSGILPDETLGSFNPCFVKRSSRRLHYSEHFKTNELLMFDIYEVVLNEQHMDLLRNEATSGRGLLILVDVEDIEKGCKTIDSRSENIGIHTKEIL